MTISFILPYGSLQTIPSERFPWLMWSTVCDLQLLRQRSSHHGVLGLITAFEILSSNQGPQGLLGRPSKQELDNVFGTHVDIDVIHQILENGKDESGESIASAKWGSKNDSRGNALDSRGSSRTTGI
jgi:Shwachman-Bodian-Diamond syndrome (SBDS) protein